jgi:putative ABC transport system permease protein
MSRWLEILFQDIRYAFRGFRRSPRFTTVAVLTAALGIGANTAVFSMINSIFLRPLLYDRPDRLVNIKEVVPAVAHLYPTLPVNGKHFQTWQQQCSSFESLALIDSGSVTLAGAGPPEQVAFRAVSWNYLQLLGVPVIAGRSFVPDEDRPGANHVVIVSDALWRRRFGSDSLRGQTIVLNGVPHMIIGVLPPWFHVPEPRLEDDAAAAPELFTPLALDYNALPEMGDFNYQAIGRVRQGVPFEKAISELNLVQSAIASSAGAGTELKAMMQPLRDSIVGNVRRGLLLLFAAVGVVLLVACVNLANLLLERASWRIGESSVRRALGASRSRLLRQTLTESILLAIIGGAFGVVIAYIGLHLLISSAPLNVPRLDEVRLDSTVLTFAVVISALSGLLFGVLPGWWLGQAEPMEALKTRGTLSKTQPGVLRELLVAAEVSMTLVLVTTGMLLLTSFVRLLHVDKGFATRNVLTLDVVLPSAKYVKAEEMDRFYTRVLAEMNTIPGMQEAGVTSRLPLQGNGSVSPMTLEGDTRLLEQRPQANYRFISSGYLRTLAIPVSGGHLFEEQDRNRKVAIISETTAKRMWPGRNPVGQHFRRFEEPPYEVIGVVADTRSINLQEQPALMVYLPYWEHPMRSASLVIRGAQGPNAMAGMVRSVIAHVDEEVPVSHLQTMDELLEGSVAQRRFQMALTVMFAASSLLLGCIGIYGVLAQTVARKTGELGIRIALGAGKPNIRHLVLRWGMRPVVIGSLAGVAGSLLGARLLRSLIYGLSATDPFMVLGATVVVLLTAALACYIPARRASSIKPMVALRFE